MCITYARGLGCIVPACSWQFLLTRIWHTYNCDDTMSMDCPNSRSSQIQSGSVSFSPEVQRKSWRNTAFFTHTSYLPGTDQIWLTKLHYCGLFAVQGERAKGSLMGEGLWMNSSGRVWTEPREMRLTSLWLVLCWGATTTMCSRETNGSCNERCKGGGGAEAVCNSRTCCEAWPTFLIPTCRLNSSG